MCPMVTGSLLGWQADWGAILAAPLMVWLKAKFLCHSALLMMCQRQRPSIHVFMVLRLTELAAQVDMNVYSRVSGASMWTFLGTEKSSQNFVKWMRPAK